MMVEAEEEPADGSYDLLCLSDGILRVIEDNAESKALLQAHRNLIAQCLALSISKVENRSID